VRNIQEVFDIVIEEGLYGCGGSYYMCHALSSAFEQNLITDDEHNKCTDAISVYIKSKNSNASLSRALNYCGEDNDSEYRLHLYKNWSKRPRLDKLTHNWDTSIY